MNLRPKALRSPSELDSRAGKNQEISDLPDYVIRQSDAHSGGGGLKEANFLIIILYTLK